jgi:hypothetical protein
MKIRAEVVFFYLYDAGRSIDLKKLAKMIPADPGIGILKNKRDTPESLSLPVPLIVQLARYEYDEKLPFDRITMNARIFEEGVISMTVRVKGDFTPQDLHKIRTTPLILGGKQTVIDTWVDESLKLFFARIQEAITFEQYVFSTFIRVSYTAFCITTPLQNPKDFVETHRRTFACLLNGESPDTDLHESQIASTLKGAFCYTEHDYALFDLDRCLIIDPNEDYEDILLVVEQANFQLLELRSLDMLLDRWLDKAEDDIKVIFKNNTAHLKLLKIKLASVHALSFDALFILENLENSSKIIGDYFLGQIFTSLCAQFSTHEWKQSIESRLKILASVYERVNANESEKRMVFLEIMFIVVCVVFPVFQILQAFFLSK